MNKAHALSLQQDHLSKARFANVRGAEVIACLAIRCLLRELETWPKPGLVSRIDSGSHSDMDADISPQRYGDPSPSPCHRRSRWPGLWHGTSQGHRS